MKLYGNLRLEREFVFCGHPCLALDIYRFPIAEAGTYDVFVEETPNSLNKPEASRIQITLHTAPGQAKGNLIQSQMCNECHGGILVCDSGKFAELGEGFADSHDTALWNYFADGVCLKRPWSHGSWKSNSIDGNIVFVPSDEFFDIYTCVGGYLVECNTGF